MEVVHLIVGSCVDILIKKRFSMEAVGIEVIRTVYDLKQKDFEYPSKDYAYRFGLVCLR